MKWIKNISIPTIGSYLALNKEGRIAVVEWDGIGFRIGSWFGGCEYGCGGIDYLKDITHWQFLPTLPKLPED